MFNTVPFQPKKIYYPVIFHSFMCGLPYRIRLALVRHGLSDWPFCGQIEVTKWAFAVTGHHSSLCPKDTTFEKVTEGLFVPESRHNILEFSGQNLWQPWDQGCK